MIEHINLLTMDVKVKQNKKQEYEIISVSVPILEYQRWLQIKLTDQRNEKETSRQLGKKIKIFKNLALNNNIRQLKISIPWSWQLTDNLGFQKASGYLVCTRDINYHSNLSGKIINIMDPERIKELIRYNAQYHHNKIPYYFRSDIEAGLQEYLIITKKNLKSSKVFILAIEKDEIVMAVANCEIDQDYLEINDLYVDEKYRGQGWGRALLAAVWQKAKDRKINKIGLFTGYNLDALGFYEHLGFEKQYLNWVKNI